MEKFVKLLKSGRVIAFPTETAYGLGGDATLPSVVEKIAKLKGRASEKPFPVIVDSIKTIQKYAELDELAIFLSARFHPGPLTIVVPSKLAHFKQGIGFRISSSEIANKLAAGLGKPIIASSANPAGGKTSYSAAEVKKLFPELEVIDQGKLAENKVSTVVKGRQIVRTGAFGVELVQAMIIGFDALQKARPDTQKKKEVKEIAEQVLSIVKKHHSDTIIGGSVAKDTFLQDLRDIDLFLMFNPADKLEDKLDLLKKIAGK
ncbi:MAG: hypothetical protein GOU99_04015, partial [Candidatus Altiarchaeota archaeon]|nr:hypothetical protein [Candidatus Altiarchaeota archaeon]